MKKTLWATSAVLAATMALMAPLPVRAGSNDAWPGKLSAANGWHGFQVKQEGGQCTLAFSKNFGATAEELRVLVRLINHDEKFNDTDCAVNVYEPLDQLKHVAVAQQNAAAARLILFAPETGKLDIDGEVAESFANTYQTLVLMGYNKLRALIPPAQEATVARDVCVGMFYGDTEEVPDENALLARLKALHMELLAAKIKRECDKEEKEYSN